jgi:hypothetical protein
MVLLENPEVAALPSTTNIKHASEPTKSASESIIAPPVTAKSTFDGIKSDNPTRSQFKLEEHPVDVVRPIKVGIIGAGLAGITAGVLLPAKLPGLDLRIYDKNADVVCQR